MAAVGFSLKHDKQFKRDFLKRFAGIEEDAENFEPTVQAANCMDLKLENPGKRILVAFEFKVGAGLADHQNPWLGGKKPDDESLPFWNVTHKGKGYGYQLGQKNHDKFSTVYFYCRSKK
ncbi:MAG: hypothetical protein KGJ60_13740 [Verrucomicrobiota bacterium]|nr:hypothetical protein [Verrucomicrobiota bacterium]